MVFEFLNILVFLKSYNDKNMDVIIGSFNSNDGSFNIILGRNVDKVNFKRNNILLVKCYIVDGIMYVVIGFVIIDFLIVIIYLYIYLKENC